MAEDLLVQEGGEAELGIGVGPERDVEVDVGQVAGEEVHATSVSRWSAAVTAPPARAKDWRMRSADCR